MPIHSVADAMHEMKAGSKHIRSRKQAIVVGLKAEGKSRKKGRKISGCCPGSRSMMKKMR